MYVFPVFNHNFVNSLHTKVSGRVESGNDAGQRVIHDQDVPEGKSTFTWNPSSSSIQTSLVELNVKVDHQDYICTPTNLYFDPKTYK